MPRHKPPSATKSHVEKPASPSSNSPQGGWKLKVIVVLFCLIGIAAVWSSGVFNHLEIFAGPKVPLPRDTAGLSLGMSMDQVLQKYPAVKKKLRPFNNDPNFNIATITPDAGMTDASSVDLLFFNKQLYFVSAMWETDNAMKLPFSDWVKQFRRWNQTPNAGSEPLGSDVMLKEWHFVDGPTEMVLRDLNYSNKIQRWEDLRDSSNGDAQAAFAKYRLEASGS